MDAVLDFGVPTDFEVCQTDENQGCKQSGLEMRT